MAATGGKHPTPAFAAKAVCVTSQTPSFTDMARGSSSLDKGSPRRSQRTFYTDTSGPVRDVSAVCALILNQVTPDTDTIYFSERIMVHLLSIDTLPAAYAADRRLESGSSNRKTRESPNVDAQLCGLGNPCRVKNAGPVSAGIKGMWPLATPPTS